MDKARKSVQDVNKEVSNTEEAASNMHEKLSKDIEIV